MDAIFGRDVNEAVHQEDADEVTHLLPAWVGRTKQGGLPHHVSTFFDTLNTCSVLYEKMEAEYHFCKFLANGAIKCLLGIFLRRVAQKMYGTVPKSLTSGVSKGKTALASEVRKSGEVQRGS